MRILHYVDDRDLSWEKPYIQLLGALRELGCENVAVCRPGGGLEDALEGAGFEVHTYRPLWGTLPQVALNFQRVVRSVRPDIIHTRLSAAANISGVWGKKLNIPVLSTVDKFPKRKYYEQSDLILPCSTPVYEHMLAQGVPPEKMQVIPNAVDVKLYARNASVREHIRKSEGLTDDTICFLGMGRLIDWKGFDDLLKGFAEFLKGCDAPDRFILWLAGDGQERDSLRKLAYALGISERVRFWGFVDDVKPLLWGADVYVHPSWGDEAFGLSLLEAMSAGLPAIASDSGGMTEILKDDCGLLFPRRNITALADRMSEALAKKDILSSAALSRAWDFDISAVAAKTLAVYRKVLNHG